MTRSSPPGAGSIACWSSPRLEGGRRAGRPPPRRAATRAKTATPASKHDHDLPPAYVSHRSGSSRKCPGSKGGLRRHRLRRRNGRLRHYAHACAQAALRRLGGRPRLPLRLHARLVAALEGPLRRGRRARRHAVPRPADRDAVVADRRRTRPTVEGESYARARDARRAAEGRPLPAARRGHARTDSLGDRITREAIWRVRDAALAPAPRAARRARAARRGRRLHRADGALPRHPDVRCASASTSRSSSTTATCR